VRHAFFSECLRRVVRGRDPDVVRRQFLILTIKRHVRERRPIGVGRDLRIKCQRPGKCHQGDIGAGAAHTGADGISWGGSAIALAAQAAYAAQMGSSSSLFGASVTVLSPDAIQQIADSVSEINEDKIGIYAQNGDVSSRIIVTAADAVNISIGNGALSLTAASAAIPNGLPSLTSIQQAYSELKSEDEGTNWGGIFDGNFTLVKLPPNTLGALGGNVVTFGSNGNNWALVLPQNTISITVSEALIRD